jgi:hypothetical protein
MADESKPQNANRSNDRSDKPSEFLSAFATAAVKWTSGPTPDPKVSASFSLGWHVAQAFAWASTGKQPQDQLGLESDMRWAVLAGQIKAGRAQLTKDASADLGGSPTPEEPQLGDPPPGNGDPNQAGTIKNLRNTLLKGLYIVDSVLGKAFLLGWELHELCVHRSAAQGDEKAAVEIALREKRETMARLLRDLASTLPANAAHSILNSLSLWEAQVTRPSTATTKLLPKITRRNQARERDVVACFRNQGFIWYSMLAGEVASKDLLRLSDYVGTGEEMVKRLRDLAWRGLHSKSGVAVVGFVAALIALGLVLIFESSHGGHLAAGLTSLIAAFGLSWKAIGNFFGRAAAKGEQALWDAQVDWTIAYRCTVPIVEPTDRHAKRNRRIDDHFATWSGWLQRWPSLSDDNVAAATPDAPGAAGP